VRPDNGGLESMLDGPSSGLEMFFIFENYFLVLADISMGWTEIWVIQTTPYYCAMLYFCENVLCYFEYYVVVLIQSDLQMSRSTCYTSS
jgi:hypothetical protein